jgi:hypothetical protein
MSEKKQVKRYRLLKDIICPAVVCRKGEESFSYTALGYSFMGEKVGDTGINFAIKDPENYPDWFEEVKDEPKAEVVLIRSIKSVGLKNHWYEILCTQNIPGNKFDAIRQAIEDIVNGVESAPDIDTIKRLAFEEGKEHERIFNERFERDKKMMKDDEIDQLQMEAFVAGRKRDCKDGYNVVYTHSTYQDYKKSIK